MKSADFLSGVARFFLITAFMTACRPEKAKDELPAVGVIVALSGDFAVYGDIVRKGIEEAAAGKDIRLIYEDERCEPAQAIKAYSKLTHVNRVKYILGPTCGSPQKAVAPLAVKNDQLLMVMSSATDELYYLSGGKVFAPQYSIQEESSFVAAAMTERGFKRVVIVYVENEFSRAHEEAFIPAFKGEIVEIFRIPFDVSHLPALATRLKSLDFDSMYVPDASPFLMGLMTQSRRLNIRAQAFSVYSAEMQAVLDMEGENIEGLIYSYPDIEEDAISYFPRIGTQIFLEAVAECRNDTACAAGYMRKHYPFDDKNILKSRLALKTVRNGKFERL